MLILSIQIYFFFEASYVSCRCLDNIHSTWDDHLWPSSFVWILPGLHHNASGFLGTKLYYVSTSDASDLFPWTRTFWLYRTQWPFFDHTYRKPGRSNEVVREKTKTWQVFAHSWRTMMRIYMCCWVFMCFDGEFLRVVLSINTFDRELLHGLITFLRLIHTYEVLG